MNENIPLSLRDLYTEAAGCLKHDFLTGASACIRLTITEFAELEEVSGDYHEERLKALKGKIGVAPQTFDKLLAIGQYEETYEDLSELSYDGRTKEQLEQMLSLLAEILVNRFASPQAQ